MLITIKVCNLIFERKALLHRFIRHNDIDKLLQIRLENIDNLIEEYKADPMALILGAILLNMLLNKGHKEYNFGEVIIPFDILLIFSLMVLITISFS
jgi:hypothetical protein